MAASASSATESLQQSQPQVLAHLSCSARLCCFSFPFLFLSCSDGTYALKVGELSGIVDTDSGVHIILRTA